MSHRLSGQEAKLSAAAFCAVMSRRRVMLKLVPRRVGRGLGVKGIAQLVAARVGHSSDAMSSGR